ncbi:MAG: fibronectin type III domain-containing protein [bacterium]|nr:fibronectin type III domain-containing protein [bacterium]
MVGPRVAPKSRPTRLGALVVALVVAVATLTPLTDVRSESQPPAEVPARPTGLQLTTEEGSLSVGADWDDVEGASGYRVRWRLAGPGHTLNEGLEVEESEATITVDGFGEWLVRVDVCDATDCRLGIQKRVRVNPASGGEISVGVDWDDVEGASGYRVRWRLAGPGHTLNEGLEVEESEATITVDDFGEWVVRVDSCDAADCRLVMNKRLWVNPAPEDEAATETEADGEAESTPEPEPANQAPTVDTSVGNHATFTGEHNAPPGVIVFKSFGGIFSDPDGDSLTYAAEVSSGRSELVRNLRIRTSGHLLFFQTDTAEAWSEAVPAPANPSEFEVTLTATDPHGATASVTGTFSTTWEQPERQPLSDPDDQASNSRGPDEEIPDDGTPAEELAVTVVADPPDPTPGQTVTMTAQVDNAPEGLVPTLTWEMNAGGWFTVRTAPEFSYAGNRDEAWDYRVTATYPNGDTATSAPITVAWLTDQARNSLTQDDEITAQSENDGVQGQQSTDTVLISTLTTTNPAGRSWFAAQSFTTGSDDATLTKVLVELSGSGTGAAVKIRADQTSGCTGTLTSCPDMSDDGEVAALTNPSSLSGDDDFTFTAPASTTLSANTTYWVTLHEGVDSRKQFKYKASPTITGATGWTVGDYLIRFAEANNWVTQSEKMLFEVQGTIASSDPSTKVTLSVSPTSIDEEDGIQSVTITGTLDGAARTSATTVTVNFGNTGTAKIGSANDYEVLPAGSGTNTITSGTITIAANQPSGSTSFRFRPVNDSIDEGTSETITITGSTTASDLTGGVESVDLTLDDDDTASTNIGLTFSVNSITEGDNQISVAPRATFGTSVARNVDTTVAVTYSTSTATLNTDYTVSPAWPTSITIPAGSTTADGSSVTLTVVDDKIHEPQELITATGTLSGFTITSERSLAMNDNDDAPDRVVLSFSPVSEGSGATTSTVTATLANSDSSKPQDIVLTEDVTVTLGLGTGGTATSGTDYTALQSPLPTVTISAGQLSGTATISITPTADTVDDDGETIPFTATATTTQSGVTLSGVGANMVITEDVSLITSLAGANNAGVSNIFLAQPFTAGSAGSAPALVTEVNVEFSNSSTQVSVRLRKDNGSNRPDMSADGLVDTLTTTDALSGTGVLTFTASASKTIILDGGETYWVTFHEGSTVSSGFRKAPRLTNTAATGQTGWTMGTRLSRSTESAGWSTNSSRVKMEVRGTLLPAVTASFATATYSATEGGTATVTVDLSTAPKRQVVIPISAANQNNASASDYSGVPESLTFGADDTSKSFTFTATDDSLDDDGESVRLSFGTLPSGVTAATSETTVVITDNDDTPTTINLSFDPTSVDEDATGNVAVKVVATLVGTSTRTVATTVQLGSLTHSSTGPAYTSSGLPSSVTIPAGQAKGEATGLTINPTDNTVSDGNRTITLAQGTPALTGFTVNDATMTITDDELPAITLSVVEDSVGNPAVTSISEASTAAKSIKIRATAATAVAANTQITLTVAGTASGSGTDYTATFPTTVTISSGSTTADTAAFNIATVDDTVSEGTETIIVSGTATGFNVNSATVNLNDNDQPLITLSLSVSSATEAAGNQAVTVSATRSASSTGQLSVMVTRQSSSTAVHGTDYTGSTSATISFAANQTNSSSATFNINPRQDLLVEGDETIVLGASVTGHTVTPATFTITDDDSASTGFSLSVNPTSLDESADSTAVTVTATVNGGAVVGNTVVGLSLGGTATGGGTDYTMTGTLPSITISAGTRSGSATINFDPVDDSLDESDGTASRPHETIVITGTKTSGDTSITTGGSATLTITDNDPTPNTINLSFEPASVDEDASGSVAVKVVATLVGDSTRTVDTTVQLGSLTDDGNGPAYTSSGLPTSVTIAAGQSKGEAAGLSINPTDNSVSDGDRTITLAQHATNTLSGFAVNAATMTIADDEIPVITVSLDIASAAESAGNQAVTVSATRPAGSKAALNVVIEPQSASTATRNTDWTTTSSSATISFAANQTSSNTATFNIDPTQDLLVEGDETIVLGAAMVTGHTVTPATFTITDDDDEPDRVFLSFADVGEGAGATTSTVTARLGNSDTNKDQNIQLLHNVVVRLTQSGGTATSGTDYAALGTLPTITISAGQNSGTASLSITPTQDTLDEGAGETIGFTATANCKTTANPCPTAQQFTGLSAPAATMTITDDDATPTVINLSFNPDRIDEDAAGDGSGNVAVTVVAALVGDSTRTVDTTVQLGSLTDDGNGPAYTSSGLPTSVTISAGQASGSATGLKINPTGNTNPDGDRTITLAEHGTNTLPNFTVNAATMTIADNETPVITLSLGTSSATEAAGNQAVSVSATRAGSSTAALSVTVRRQSASTAVRGTDYSGSSTATISFAAGNTTSNSATFNINPTQDLLVEGDETVVLGATVAGHTVTPATFTITDDDDEPDRVFLSFADVGEGAGATTSTVTARLGNSDTNKDQNIQLLHDVVVRLAGPSGGSATSGTDYAALGTLPTVRIPAGNNSGTASLSITPTQDNLDEGAGETIGFTATANCKTTADPCPADQQISGLTAPAATMTITDDDVTVNFSSATLNATEGGGAVTVTVTLSEAPGRSLTIPITHTPGGGATAQGQTGADYSGVPASVAFSATQTSRSFTITATDDDVDDDGESVELGFGTITDGAEAGTTSTATVSIIDNDHPDITVEFSSSGYIVTEDGTPAPVTVTLSAPPKRAVTIPITTANQGGAENADYSGVPSGGLAFGATETSKSFTVTAVDDAVDDDGESVVLGFGSTLPDGITASGTTEATVAITDNDDPIVSVMFSRDQYTAREGDADGTTVTVTLSADPERTVVVPITHAPMGGAIAGDYTLSDTSVTFNAGETESTFTITATDDSDDDDESVRLGFGSTLPDRVNLGTPSTATVPITDNNAPHVTEVRVVGQPADGQTYRAGEFITLHVTFSEGIRVTRRGNVYLSLHSADGWFGARALRGWNSGVLRLWGGWADVGEEYDTMEFRYRVSQGDQAADELVVGTHRLNGGGLVLTDGLQLTGVSGELIDPAIDPMGFGFKVDGGDAPRTGRTDGGGGLLNASGPCRRDISLGRWHGSSLLRNAWGVGCESRANPGTYAAYFTFTLASDSQVRLHAQGGAPAQATLRLRAGRAYTGEVTATAAASGYGRARIDAFLPAGTYTLEVAPTRHDAAVPDVSGLGYTLWAGTVVAPPAIGDCVTEISRGHSAAARWDASCDSVTNTGRRAHYYSFTGDGGIAEFTVTSPDATEEAFLWEWDSQNRGSAQVDSATSGSASCHNRCAHVFHRTIAGRTYTLEVTGDDASAGGRYLAAMHGGAGAMPPNQCIADLGRVDHTNAELRQMGRSRPNGWQFGHMVGRRNFEWPCFSADRPATYAKYFTFSVDEARDVRLEIYGSNAAGVSMVLRRGTATSGGPAAGSHHPGQPVQSRLDQRLLPGTYTVEVRAASTGRTSAFELIIKQGPPQWVPADQCVEELPLVLDGGGIWESGTWAEPCWSNARAGRHARWYTFTVTPAQAADGFNLNMSLLSQDADPYLILRQGLSYTGWAIAEVDDSWRWGSWLSAFDAQIIRNGLPAGTYTIEAATDRNGLRGDNGAFSLAASIRTPLEAPDPPTGLSATASTTEFDKITASWTLPAAPPNKPRTAVVVQWTSAVPASQKLVSNTGQTNNGEGNLDVRSAQGFTTGSNTGGYKLTSVDVHFSTIAASPSVSVAIYTSSSGEPASQLAALSNPASLTSGINTFTASGQGINLDPNTKYFVYFAGGDSDTHYTYAPTAGNEDSGAAAGWSIDNINQWDNPWDPLTSTGPIRVAIKGYARGTAAPAGSQLDGTAVLGAGATTHTISGLAHDTDYTFTVKARNSEGESSTATATATTMNISPPAAATGVVATGTAHDSIHVTWTNGASTNAAPRTAVVVTWNTTSDGNTVYHEVLPADTTSHTITGLTASTAYSVAIYARNPAGDSSAARQALDVSTLANPAAMWFTADTPSIRLGDSSSRAFFSISSTASGAFTCQLMAGITINCPGTLVSIAAFATGGSSGDSFHSQLVDATTRMEGGTTRITINRIKYEAELVMRAWGTIGGNSVSTEWNFYSHFGGPAAPQIAVSAGNQKITVGWTPPALNSNGEYGKPGNVLSGYQVWHRAQNADKSWPAWTKSAWLAANVREHEITGLTNDVTVQVRVRARAESNNHNGVLTQYEGMTTGSCPHSQREMCNATPVSGAGSPSTPQNFSASAGSDAGELNVFWGAPATPAGGVHLYRVEYKLTTDSTWTAVLVSGLTTSTTITGLTSSSAYHVRVRAEGAAGDSAYTANATATPT